MNKFFVATPLDFEKRALAEMKDIWPYLLGKDAKPHALPFPEVAVLEGGLEFETELFIGLQLNFFLKTTNRILLRMTSFKAKDLPKFYQKFKSLPWLDFLPHANVTWEVAAQKSRLNNEKRLQESAETALIEIFKGQKGPESCASIYIRMDDDLCTISLDSTGDHLHKRGWSVLKGEAPLRETIAAFLLEEMIGNTPAAELAGITLLDPMMGSGTFLGEARALWAGQFARDFAFKKWKRAPKLFASPSFALNYTLPARMPFKSYIGYDIDVDMIPAAEKNFAEVERQLKAYQRAGFVAAPHKFIPGDALKLETPGEGPLWLVVNPPYGERLPVAGQGGLKMLIKELCLRHKPQKMGVLYPEKERLSEVPAGYKLFKEIRINNGGLRCLFTILTRL
ncbi:RNA methyltransferase [Bdellovibrio bacteriovorus]|uniref:THUMP domain-containing class I SAM-dependent RNA methyltransferase n=1 Tax=Bdellovibrio bacteriovorus TaxID=959 RepID=UPI0021D39AED|nr:RNA methyltransferase [Bdellovibrio bacteriovorus]UXR63228.1 RNA methyltransferase [Bdellovibrio bacteriovorus]